jgi:hypothetical protein
MRKFFKIASYLVSFLITLLGFFGKHILPENWTGVMKILATIEGWLFANVDYPMLFLIGSVFLLIVLIPDIIKQLDKFIYTSAKLKLSFEDSKDCFRFTPMYNLTLKKFVPPGETELYESQSYNAWFVRIRIENESPISAKKLEARIVSVAVKRGDRYEDTNYSDNMRLDGLTEPIHKGIRDYCNVFSLNDMQKEIILEGQPRLLAHADIFKAPGYYKLEIQVSCENGKPKRISLGLDWRGVYEKPRVELLK